MVWHCLKNQEYALPESLSGGVENDESKEVSADRVDEPQFRPEENDCRSHDDSYRVEKVTEDVKECSINVQVSSGSYLLVTVLVIIVLAVIMVMLVIMIVIVIVMAMAVAVVVLMMIVSVVAMMSSMRVPVSMPMAMTMTAALAPISVHVTSFTGVKDLNLNKIKEERQNGYG